MPKKTNIFAFAYGNKKSSWYKKSEGKKISGASNK
jgi:hypothetical protein